MWIIIKQELEILVGDTMIKILLVVYEREWISFLKAMERK